MFRDSNWYSIYLTNTRQTPVFLVLDQQVVTGRSGMFWVEVRSLACFASRHFIRYLTSWAFQSVSIHCVPYLSVDPRHQERFQQQLEAWESWRSLKSRQKNTLFFSSTLCKIWFTVVSGFTSLYRKKRRASECLNISWRIGWIKGGRQSSLTCMMCAVSMVHWISLIMISGWCRFNPFHVSITLSQNEQKLASTNVMIGFVPLFPGSLVSPGHHLVGRCRPSTAGAEPGALQRCRCSLVEPGPCWNYGRRWENKGVMWKTIPKSWHFAHFCSCALSWNFHITL